MNAFIKIASNLANKSTHRCFHHVALVIKGGSIISYGTNRNNIHAETSAINSLWPDKRKGSTLVSLRFTKGNLLAMAKPCPNCLKAIKEAGIKKILYSTPNRTLEILKIT